MQSAPKSKNKLSDVTVSKFFMLFLIASLSGCASPSGSNWALADFNKYNRNYAPFPTNQLIIGANKSDVLAALGSDYETVEAGSGFEILAFQQWVSIAGPDYVSKTLYLQLVKNKLKNWKITSDTIAIVPRSW